jgi:hypothetical protein
VVCSCFAPTNNVLEGISQLFCSCKCLTIRLFLQNAKAQRLPFTVNPAIIYRGTGAALMSEIAQMGTQFATTGFFQKMLGSQIPRLNVSDV